MYDLKAKANEISSFFNDMLQLVGLFFRPLMICFPPLMNCFTPLMICFTPLVFCFTPLPGRRGFQENKQRDRLKG